MSLVRKRVRPKMDPEKAEYGSVPAHLRFIRTRECCACLASGQESTTKIEAHHVRDSANAGTGMKPPDWFAVPLCQKHHKEFHDHGPLTFETRYGIALDDIAAEAWRLSPAGRKHRAALAKLSLTMPSRQNEPLTGFRENGK